MKKILLVMPNYYGFDEVVYEGLIKYSGCEVYKLNYDVGFRYKNIGQKVRNFLSKVFLKKNIKDHYKEAYFLKYVQDLGELDLLVFNRPDILPVGLLEKLITNASQSKLILWDSLKKVPMDLDVLSLFTATYSFDREDCKRFGCLPLNNFYFDTEDESTELIYDAVFLGTVDNRINNLELVLNNLMAEGMKVKAFLHITRERKLKKKKGMEILNGIVPFKDASSFTRKSKVIIDIAHSSQVGLSFRFFEAMGLHKKVITTNKDVRNHDFFRESNIFVIDDVRNFSIPLSFWEEGYEPLPASTVEKYSLESWVRTILD